MVITAQALPGLVWVTVEKATEHIGLSRQSIYARIKRREWQKGREYKKCGQRLFVNIPAVYAWIERA